MNRSQEHLLLVAAFVGPVIAGTMMNMPTASAANPVPGSAPVNIVSPVPLPVSVRSTPSSPLYIRDVDNPAHNAFAQYLNCAIAPSETACDAQFTVPVGKALVIETISALFGVQEGAYGWLQVNFATNGAGMTVALPGTAIGTSSPFTLHAVTQPVRLYADSGGKVIAHFYVSALVPETLSPVLQMWVSGHFVTCGAGTGCPLP